MNIPIRIALTGFPNIAVHFQGIQRCRICISNNQLFYFCTIVVSIVHTLTQKHEQKYVSLLELNSKPSLQTTSSLEYDQFSTMSCWRIYHVWSKRKEKKRKSNPEMLTLKMMHTESVKFTFSWTNVDTIAGCMQPTEHKQWMLIYSAMWRYFRRHFFLVIFAMKSSLESMQKHSSI